AGGLSRCERRDSPRRVGVLPAAVLRSHLASVRVPAAAKHLDRHARGHLLGRELVARHSRAARTIAPRPPPADSRSAGTVPAAGGFSARVRRLAAGAAALL